MRKTWIVFVLAIAALLFYGFTRSEAVEPNEFEVLIPASRLDSRAGNGPNDPSFRTRLSPIVVRVGGQDCLTVDPRNTAGDLLLRLGAPGQPAHCSVAGSQVVLCYGLQRQSFFVKYTFIAGQQQVFTNLAPDPPRDGPGPIEDPCALQEESSSVSGAFLVIPAALLDLLMPDGASFASSISPLSVFVGAQECVTRLNLAFRNSAGNVFIRLGGPGNPACSVLGAPVTLCTGRGEALAVSPTIIGGLSYVLSSLALEPPGGSANACRAPGPTDTPAPTETPRPSITPPAAGDGGLR